MSGHSGTAALELLQVRKLILTCAGTSVSIKSSACCTCSSDVNLLGQLAPTVGKVNAGDKQRTTAQASVARQQDTNALSGSLHCHCWLLHCPYESASTCFCLPVLEESQLCFALCPAHDAERDHVRHSYVGETWWRAAGLWLSSISISGADHLSSSLGPRGVHILQYLGSLLLRSSLCTFSWCSRGHLGCGKYILRPSRTKKRGDAALFHRLNGMHTRCTRGLAAGANYCNIPPGKCTSRPKYRHRQSKYACACQLESWSCTPPVHARTTQPPKCRQTTDHCCTMYPLLTAVLQEYCSQYALTLSCSMHAVQQKMNRQLARRGNLYKCDMCGVVSLYGPTTHCI